MNICKRITLLTLIVLLTSLSLFSQVGIFPTGSFHNIGDLSVKQDFISTGTLSMGASSKLVFSGTARQYVTGNGTIDVRKLEIMNPTFIQLEVALNVQDSLLFRDGYIDVGIDSAKAILNFATETSGYSNENENRFVKGWVSKQGGSAFTFPTGDVSLQRIAISSSGTPTDVFRVRYLRNNNLNLNRKDGCIDNISSKEFWDVERTTGTSNVAVTLEWDTYSGAITDINQMAVSRYNPITTTWESEGARNITGVPALGLVTSGPDCDGLGTGDLATFGRFSLASFSNVNVLPVTLLDFQAKVEGDEVRLDWTTLTEQRNAYFVIEKSVDGKLWSKVGEVKSKDPNSKVRQDYYLYDYDPYIGGVSYYRISQFDFDGNSHIYNDKIRHVFMVKDIAIQVYPNPMENYLFIKSPSVTPENISVVDAIGRLVDVDYTQMDGKIKYNVQHLAKGVYFMRIEMNTRIITRKITKQ